MDAPRRDAIFAPRGMLFVEPRLSQGSGRGREHWGSSGSDAGPGELPNGALCASAGSCVSGFCVSGVCCDTQCDALCTACTASGKESGEQDGVCGPAKAETDPRGECPEDGPEGCQRNGKCDGAGACSLYPAGTQCSGTTCSNGVKTLPKLCNGKGECAALGLEPCEPPQCAGDLCISDCIDDSELRCDGVLRHIGQQVPRQAGFWHGMRGVQSVRKRVLRRRGVL